MYRRLLVHVEGRTEESFVRNVVRPELIDNGYHSVQARLIGDARQRYRRGGAVSWTTARKNIIRHLKADRKAISTTMVDYYGLPQFGARAWPGRAQSDTLPHSEKASTIETCMENEIQESMGESFNKGRFIPFVMMHEFEALLFSHCGRFSRAIEMPQLKEGFQRIANMFASPEEIDDSSTTAPSKRIMKLFPRYRKVLFGTLGALEIGLETMLDACPHFSEWWQRLLQEH